MSYGWDVSELLAIIKNKDEELSRMVPNCLTESEIRLVHNATMQTHDPRIGKEWQPEPASALRKLRMALDEFERKRREDSDFISSMTKEEIQFIRDQRRKAHAGKQP